MTSIMLAGNSSRQTSWTPQRSVTPPIAQGNAAQGGSGRGISPHAGLSRHSPPRKPPQSQVHVQVYPQISYKSLPLGPS